MHFRNNGNRRSVPVGAKTFGRPTRCRRGWALACLAAMTFLTCAALPGQQAPSPDADKPHLTPRGNNLTPKGNNLTPKSNNLADADKGMQMGEQQPGKQNEAAPADRKKQIAEDSAKLLKLATALKTEVDKTTLDTLSLTVIRKADEIEKLAHSIREKMKTTVGPAP
jgi:hypothetical protein